MDVCAELSTCTELQITIIWLFNILVFGMLSQLHGAVLCIHTQGAGQLIAALISINLVLLQTDLWFCAEMHRTLSSSEVGSACVLEQRF